MPRTISCAARRERVPLNHGTTRNRTEFHGMILLFRAVLRVLWVILFSSCFVRFSGFMKPQPARYNTKKYSNPRSRIRVQNPVGQWDKWDKPLRAIISAISLSQACPRLSQAGTRSGRRAIWKRADRCERSHNSSTAATRSVQEGGNKTCRCVPGRLRCALIE